jgi:hypothetical protein
VSIGRNGSRTTSSSPASSASVLATKLGEHGGGCGRWWRPLARRRPNSRVRCVTPARRRQEPERDHQEQEASDDRDGDERIAYRCSSASRRRATSRTSNVSRRRPEAASTAAWNAAVVPGATRMTSASGSCRRSAGAAASSRSR